MTDVLDDLSVEQLPQIQGYNGDYTDEEWVFATFAEAAEEIKQLRALNEKAARCLSIAHAALGTLALGGNHIASNAVLRMGEIADA